MNKTEAEIFRLKVKDFIKGLILAVIISVLTFIVQILQTVGTISLKQIGIAAIVAFCGYILKNLSTNSDDQFLTAEKK